MRDVIRALQRLPLPKGPLLGLAGLVLLFVVLLALRGQVGKFLSPSNLQVLCHKNSVTAVIALGMLLVIVSGGIDLSVGSVAALVAIVTMQVYRLVYEGPGPVVPERLLEWLQDHGLALEGTA